MTSCKEFQKVVSIETRTETNNELSLEILDEEAFKVLNPKPVWRFWPVVLHEQRDLFG